MKPEDIRVSNPDEVKACVMTALSHIEKYENIVVCDVLVLDEVEQLCEKAKLFALDCCERLHREQKWALGQDAQQLRNIQKEVDRCRLALERLDKYVETIESFKSDAAMAVDYVRSVLEDGKETKMRVDALMDALIALK